MRDFLVTAIVFGAIPFIFRRPFIGVILWTWLSLMSPHRLCWSYAYDMPFSQLVAIALLLSVLFSKEDKSIPWSPIMVVWVMFIFWMGVTTVFAYDVNVAFAGWTKSMKIQLMVLVTIMVMKTPERLKLFTMAVALSIAFFGVKGGIFTVTHGASSRVYGPPGSFISGNNEVAFALVVIIPLLRYLQMQTTNKLHRLGYGAAMALSGFAILGSYSRGAFLAIIAMGVFLIWKSRRRALLGIGMVILVPLALALAPAQWFDRMGTIQTYEEDSSAMGRIQAWTVAFNMAKSNPLTGGGYHWYSPELFARYGDSSWVTRDIHSIYFEIMGEQGFVGFFLFMLLAYLSYRAAGWSARAAQADPSLAWHGDLGRMTQVALVGYAVGGAFLGLAYFDLLYNLFAIAVVNRVLLKSRLKELGLDQEWSSGRASPPPLELSGARMSERT